ncbi:hypothetical protein GLYMA_U032705v4 [Glycine max]|uniref:uncharacterized protein n=1 Tax=Glycine max TaxID=3847 RepID=UPI001B355112|nr:uncharacterized protein LOC100819642 [Glycine max]XP_040869595.1 uncharacterized protein LOC100819642 [Glycine max]KAG4109082.1 hypothetical protein GLYMA_U032705v4 [Glycine max]
MVCSEVKETQQTLSCREKIQNSQQSPLSLSLSHSHSAAMDDPPLQKIAISGPTLASLIQRFSTSPSSLHGLLFGHVTPLPLTLSDDDDDTSSSATLLATVTGFLTSPSFHDSSGTVLPSSLPTSSPLLGWFSARRRSPLRPSMREFSVTSSLSSLSQFSSQIQNPNSISSESSLFPPCIFLLLASPSSSDHHHSHVHTHEYRAFQFRPASLSFEPRSLDVINIGPAFRGHYGAFAPNSNLPPLDCGPHDSPMISDGGDETMGKMKQAAKDQRELDQCAEGFEVGRLGRMMGSEAKNYTEGLEELYQKMLVKIENLSGLVEKSSAMVIEQENHNRKLKHKILRSAASE